MSESTLFGKVWSDHVVTPETESTPAILYVDLHLVHEVTSPQAFEVLRERGLRVRRPDRTMATMDHSTPTTPRPAKGPRVINDQEARAQIERLERNCKEQGVGLYALGDERQGIVHVIAPELGLTRPGMTITCGDSHTSTHGAFGALAFGIGTSEVGHVLATQCLLQRRPRTMRATIDGTPPRGVSAKDVVLALIAKIGTAGGTGHVIEYAGSTIRAMSMEERMTVCNMTIEGGATLATSSSIRVWVWGEVRGGRPLLSARMTSARSSIVAGASLRASRRTLRIGKFRLPVVVREMLDHQRAHRRRELKRRADAAKKNFRDRPARGFMPRADPAQLARDARHVRSWRVCRKSCASTAKHQQRAGDGRRWRPPCLERAPAHRGSAGCA